MGSSIVTSVMHSTAHLDTPSDVPSLQLSSSITLDESDKTSIVLSNNSCNSKSDVPTGKPYVFQ